MNRLFTGTALIAMLAAGPTLAEDKTTVTFLHKYPEPESMQFFEAALPPTKQSART